MMASRVAIPGFNIELADFAVGTKNVGVPIQESLEDLSVTFYNTGDEYKSIYGLKNAIYNPLKFTVAYYSDIIVNNITVCFFRTLSQTSFTSSTVTSPQTISIMFDRL